MARITKRRRQRGLAMVDVLAACAIISVTMLGSVGIFFSVLTLTNRTSESSVAESLARRAIEEAKVYGFNSLVDGTTTYYYDWKGTLLANSTGASFTVSTTVATDSKNADGTPATNSLRTVTVTVSRKSDSATLETTSTYLAGGGA